MPSLGPSSAARAWRSVAALIGLANDGLRDGIDRERVDAKPHDTLVGPRARQAGRGHDLPAYVREQIAEPLDDAAGAGELTHEARYSNGCAVPALRENARLARGVQTKLCTTTVGLPRQCAGPGRRNGIFGAIASSARSCFSEGAGTDAKPPGTL